MKKVVTIAVMRMTEAVIAESSCTREGSVWTRTIGTIQNGCNPKGIILIGDNLIMTVEIQIQILRILIMPISRCMSNFLQYY
jgi:hypothetical protein